jgi:hypothetical protein
MRLQYTAVGIQNVSRMALTRDDYMKDLENLALSMRYAVWNCSLDLPVKLIAVSWEGARSTSGSAGRWYRKSRAGRRTTWAGSQRNSVSTSSRRWSPRIRN